jgi:hypothetical protein
MNDHELLYHIHHMLHALSKALHGQGNVLNHIASVVDGMTPGVDPKLAAALAESQIHHDALQAAINAVPPVV